MIGAVSPATRVMASSEDVRMPGSEKGSTHLRIVCQRVPPMASEASRNPWGTARSDSSEAVMTTGRIMQASVAQPAMSDEFQPWKLSVQPSMKSGSTSSERSTGVAVMTGAASTNTEKPKRPNTIEGMPARLRIASRTAWMKGLCIAYSAR